MMLCTVVCIAAVAFVTGCDDDDDDELASAGGTWNLVDSDGDTSTLVINQANNVITGTLTSGGTTIALSEGSGISGSTLTCVVIVGDQKLTLVSTVSGNTLINGSFSDTSGGSGTFTGTKQ